MLYLHDHYDQIRSIAHSPVSKKPTEEEEQQLKDAEEELETTRNPIVARKAQEYIDLCALQLPMAGLQVHHISCGLMHTVCSAGECGWLLFCSCTFDTCTCNLLWSVCHCTVRFWDNVSTFNLV